MNCHLNGIELIAEGIGVIVLGIMAFFLICGMIGWAIISISETITACEKLYRRIRPKRTT